MTNKPPVEFQAGCQIASMLQRQAARDRDPLRRVLDHPWETVSDCIALICLLVIIAGAAWGLPLLAEVLK